MFPKVVRLMRKEDGASAVEYGLIIGLIAVALVLVLIALGGPDGLGGLFQEVADCVSDPQNNCG